MKRVVIGMKDGVPYVVSKQGKVEVIFKVERPKTLRKRVRMLMYRMKAAFKIAG